MTLLLTQMAIVLLITLACGWLALKLGQARVIGEIIGGILVGPSVFGRFALHLSAQLFPISSFAPFETLADRMRPPFCCSAWAAWWSTSRS